jgi:AcrR family transcriptional regulator
LTLSIHLCSVIAVLDPKPKLTALRRWRKTTGPGRPRSESADRAILGAALEVFIERGIDGASIEEIAEKAGVARTTLYRRWSSKEDLIARAIGEMRGDPEQRAVSKRIPLKQLPRVLTDALAEMFTRPEFQKVVARLIGSVPTCPELMETYWSNCLAPRRRLISSLLEQARSQGLIRDDADPELLMDLISGAVIHHTLLRPGRHDREEMRRYLMSVLDELGLAGDRGRSPAKRT